MPHPYRSHILEHWGLVAGLCDALGLGEVIDRATRHHPATRLVTTGDAVKALVLNGLGCVNPPLDLGSRFVQDHPTSRLLAPLVIAAHHLPDDALGRALAPLYADGVTARSRLMAATAAARRGLAPPGLPRDRTSGHVAGRDHRDTPPDEQVVPMTRGDRREPRPDLPQGMLALLVEPHAGMPVLMQPRSGHSSEAPACGPSVRAHIAPWHPTYGPTAVVAAAARYREANLQTLAKTPMQWITRVPATVYDAPSALAQAAPATMLALTAGAREHVLPSP